MTSFAPPRLQAKCYAKKPYAPLRLDDSVRLGELVEICMGDRVKKIRTESRLASKSSAETQSDQRFRSDAFEAIHSVAQGMHAVGAIDAARMREYDASCLAMPKVRAADIQRILRAENVSAEVLAKFLGVTAATVRQWESGDRIPSQLAQRLLHVIDKHGLNAII